jgi:predicted RNase H-like HicB family nuclease
MSYTADLELDERGWWVATIREVEGCYTQGRSVHQALSRLREALLVCVEDAADEEIEPHFRLPAEARRAVERCESARRKLERERLAARQATDEAVEVLTGRLGLSVRDAGEVLGLSHQRIHQVRR